MIERSTLAGGLQLATVTMPHAYSITVRVAVTVGSRYETEAEAGTSHFIEHLLFKGTERRPTPRDLALAIEGVGGDLNASTGRELTAFFARVSRYDLALAIDVLLDMLRNSRFEPDDVERERQVIVEEISESLDLPDELAGMTFEALLWPDHPLGRDVAGTRASVRALDRGQLLDFFGRNYVAPRVVVAVAGDVTHDAVHARLEPLLTGWDGTDGAPSPTTLPPAVGDARALHRPVEQCHFCLGCRGVDRFDPDRYAFGLLDTILGEGMSSRLFTEIREERGLAYSIYTFASHLRDTGSFGIYAALDPSQLDAAIEAVLAQLTRLRDEPVSDEELRLAKSYVRGRTHLRLEDTGAFASLVGNQVALGDRLRTPDEMLADIDRVTADDIQRVARRLFRDDRLTLSVVGPVNEDRDWQGLLGVE